MLQLLHYRVNLTTFTWLFTDMEWISRADIPFPAYNDVGLTFQDMFHAFPGVLFQVPHDIATAGIITVTEATK